MSYSSEVLADTPKGYWKLADASGNFADASGNTLTLTAAGTLTYQQTGPFASELAILFGSGGKGSRAQISAVVDNLTIECWVFPTSYTANATIFANINGATNGYELGMTSGGKIQVVCQGVAVIGGAGTTVPLSAWTHVVVQRVAGVWKAYFNGVVDQSNMGSNAPVAPSGATTGLASNTSFAGRLAHAAFYESALTARRIATHYNAAFPIAASSMASGEAEGRPTVSRTTNDVAISSAETVPAPAVSRLITGRGIASTETVPAPVARRLVSAQGITSAGAVGRPVIIGGIIPLIALPDHEEILVGDRAAYEIALTDGKTGDIFVSDRAAFDINLRD